MIKKIIGSHRSRIFIRSFFIIAAFFFFSAGDKCAASEEGMILIPAGPFKMGSSDKDIMWAARHFHSESLDWYRDETPLHEVTLPAFKIDKVPVTMRAFSKYQQETGQPPSREHDNALFNHPLQPVVSLPWKQARDYCHWAKKRLPTEAEWEKAARGTDGRYYPWGNEADALNANIRGKGDIYRYTNQGGTIPENVSPYGVMDLAGNVWEWTENWYQPHPGNQYENDLYGEQFKVIKGGSWNSNLDLARGSVRGKALPGQKKNYIGFRCVAAN